MQKFVQQIAFIILACTMFAGPRSAAASETGRFDRTLAVSGAVHLEVSNGSGSVQITGGAPGQVRIHGEVRISDWMWSSKDRLSEIIAHPPIEQSGNTIRIGADHDSTRNVSISYTIEVPEQTEVESSVGAGNQTVRKIRGPAKLTTGSGNLFAESIHDDAHLFSGSGAVRAIAIGGELRATSGSGSVDLTDVHGDIRSTTGSGTITIAQPSGRVTAKTGSGSINIRGAGNTLSARTGSGSLTIEGNPSPNSFWELDTGSGSVNLGVPPNANFRLSASVHGGSINTQIPIVVEEQSRHALRARIGTGSARIEVHSGSGSIHIH
ncbi:MAG TPA: DUF4097 family beta strand repeat-containing protein [Candidatus Dormibacteraeota bacterium]|nr:DUF4097 family beta strand repeat-containing protein [Candidatus Dormibacteraeota bacterium]